MSQFKLSFEFIHCSKTVHSGRQFASVQLLPYFVAKVLQGGHASHLQVHKGALHYLQLPACHHPATKSADTINHSINHSINQIYSLCLDTAAPLPPQNVLQT